MSKSTKDINFKSLVSGIDKQDDIYDKIAYALGHQYLFEKWISPWESHNFPNDNFNNFKIKIKNIDRLYHISSFEGIGGNHYEMLARMDNNGKKIYVSLTAGCGYTGFGDGEGGNGFISICYNVDVFKKYMLDDKKNNDDDIYKCLENNECLEDKN
nr:MAG: hypothetical protein [Metapenaeopsis lamellata majanivirus]